MVGAELQTGFATCRDGSRLYFERGGPGNTLIVINNFFMNAEHWRPLLCDIRAGSDVVCYDLRFQGRSDRGDVALSIRQHVADLEDLIAGLGAPRVWLMGSCVSTLIARDFALLHPELVAGLVLVGPIFGVHGTLGRKFFHRSLINTLNANGAAGLFDHYYPLLYSGRTLRDNRTPGYLTLKAAFLNNNSEDQLRTHLGSTVTATDPPNGLGDISCPVLLLCGEDDFINDRVSLRQYEADYSSLQVRFLEGGGHNPYLEVSDLFQHEVARFLKAPE